MSRRNTFLKEMGVGPVWTLRTNEPTAQEASAQLVSEVPAVLPPAPSAVVLSKPAAVPEREFFEDAFPEDIPPPFFDDIPWEDGSRPQTKIDVSGMDWEQLETAILKCTACGLCQQRTQAVPGTGDRNAAWLFVGEGPGFSEDRQGEPFVGPSGKLLDNMLLAMQLRRGQNAYIANIVKCRPTDANGRDRPPTPDEAAACRPFLDRQIALIQPEIIVALGRTAATMLLGSNSQTSLSSLRGKVHPFTTQQGLTIPLVATYHPAYLLRQLPDKKKAWADLCLAMRAQAGSPG